MIAMTHDSQYWHSFFNDNNWRLFFKTQHNSIQVEAGNTLIDIDLICDCGGQVIFEITFKYHAKWWNAGTIDVGEPYSDLSDVIRDSITKVQECIENI